MATPIPPAPNMPGLPPASSIPVTVSLPPNPGDLTDEVLYVQGIIAGVSQAKSATDGQIASLEVQEREFRDELEFRSSIYASQCGNDASKYGSDQQIAAANIQAGSTTAEIAARLQAAELQASNQLEIAILEANTRTAIATQDTTNEANIAAARLLADEAIANAKIAADQALAQGDNATRLGTANISASAQTTAAGIEEEGRKYDADQRYAGQVYDADRGYAGTQLHETSETARLETKIGYAETKYNQIFPIVEQSLANSANATPHLSYAPPFIDSSGYYSPGEIQDQVNAVYARNDRRTTSQIRTSQSDLAGRGFGGNSPLLAALQVGYAGNNLKASADAAREIRFNAAKLNGDAVFQGQEALSTQWNQANQAALESERNQVTRQVGLVGALANLIGGLS